MTDALYNTSKKRLATADLDWETADLRVLLLKGSGYTFDPDHDFVSQLTPASNECTATNYARQTLTGESVNRDDTNDKAQLLAGNVTITDLGNGDSPQEVIQALVIYVHNAADAAARLVCYQESFAVTLTGETAILAWPAGVVAEIP